MFSLTAAHGSISAILCLKTIPAWRRLFSNQKKNDRSTNLAERFISAKAGTQSGPTPIPTIASAIPFNHNVLDET